MRATMMTMPTRSPIGGRTSRTGSLLLLAASACSKFASELDPGDETGQQALQLDPGDWSCVSDEAGNPAMPADGPPIDYPIEARDFLSGQTPTNLRIRACYRPDVNCTRPATDWSSPDAAGIVSLPLTEGFNGYLEITGDDEVSTLYVFPAPLSGELVSTLSPSIVPLLPPDALRAFGESSQLALDPNAGVVSVNTFDCAGPSAPGVRLELNVAAVPFAFIDGLPIAGFDTTTDEGSAGFANVQPGLVVLRGFRSDTMAPVGLETVLVRSSWVTVCSLMPQFAGTP
jgi:hypothetical protein